VSQQPVPCPDRPAPVEPEPHSNLAAGSGLPPGADQPGPDQPGSEQPGSQRSSSDRPSFGPGRSSDRIWTIPNMISFVRLIGVPVFLYLLLAQHADVAAVVVLAVGGTTDWVDGYVARRLGQVSRLGELLDPFADRLYILATLIAFTIRDVVPWQFTVALLSRELVLGISLIVLRRYGYGPPPVHYVGKAATFVLLGAFPLLLVATAVPAAAAVVAPIAWGLAWWGLGLYWAAAVLYLVQSTSLLRAERVLRAKRAGAAAG
jgi:cardiolipin synthase